MKLNEFPQSKSLTRLALITALSGCGGQQAKPANTASEPACDVSKPGNYEVIKKEPMRTVYRVCDEVYEERTVIGVTSATPSVGSTSAAPEAEVVEE